ncbi:MAG: DUF4384 domain-containing protein [Treponema sp.]|jgi:hypothetical protein|nr:DUF4384 domain-containing protein [Treponema sp.]
MKKVCLLTGILLFFGICVFSQDMDTKIREAVDELVVKLNAPIEVSIGLISIAETNTPTEFSRYLHNKITSFAAGNNFYKVVEETGASRGVNRIRTGGETRGELTGMYQKIGGNVEVTLYLKSRSGGTAISSSGFSVPAAELEKMRIAILPANNASESHAREKEAIFSALKERYPQEEAIKRTEGFHIETWMDSVSGTYYEGDTMTVYFVSDRNCYYKMYYIDARGRMSMIYPTRGSGSNFLRGNAVKEMKFACTPPYGNETFLLMACEEPFAINPAEYTAVDASTGAVERALRGLQYKEGGGVSAEPAATARFSYTILEKR